MKSWFLPTTLRGGGTCLVLAALLAPLGAQERPQPKAGEPERPHVKVQERGGGEGQNRNPASNPSEGEAQNRKQIPPASVGEAPNRKQIPPPSAGEAPNRAKAQGGAAQEPAQSPTRRPIQVPSQTLGPAAGAGSNPPSGRTSAPPASPARPQPWTGGGATPRSEPTRQPGPPPAQPGGWGQGHTSPPAPAPAEPRNGSGARLITPPRTIIVQPPAGGEVHREPGGALREVHAPNGAVIRYAPDGQRRVVVDRPDGRRFVATPGGRGGYIQRPLQVQGQTFQQRTYVRRGVVTAQVYRPWPYRGVNYMVYQPVRYYRPAFYTWTCQPWRRPVYYSWGWSRQPWYGYYGGWCRPYPYYVSPVFWLTDFVIALTLEDAYQARLDSAAASAPPPPPPAGGLTPDVKQAIADEVQRQLQQEQDQQRTAAQGALPAPVGPPPLFSDNVSRIFLVHVGVPAYLDGQELYLSEGDVVQLQGAPPAGAAYADVKVLASRSPQVPRGGMVSVSLVDLQEMQNHMQATLDQGMDQLQGQQGQAGLPAMPPQNLGAANAPYLAGVQPDANAATELSQVAQDATQSGRVISEGMTMEEVHRVLGSPRETATVGGKWIEVFPNFKVTYLEGRVTDVQ